MSTDDRKEPTEPSQQPKCGVPLRIVPLELGRYVPHDLIGPPPPGAEIEIGPTMTFFGPYGRLLNVAHADADGRFEPFVVDPYFFNPGPTDEGADDGEGD